jgi:hypothetical protein
MGGKYGGRLGARRFFMPLFHKVLLNFRLLV